MFDFSPFGSGMDKRTIFMYATVLAGLGIALGAIGSHALKETLLSKGRTDTFETAVRYQLYHALAMFVVGILYDFKSKILSTVALLFLVGAIGFSGSLYLLSLTSLNWAVYLTPLGGMLMISGWILLLVYFLRMKK